MIPIHDDNPTRSRPLVTYALIAICTVVYVWQSQLGEQLNQRVVLQYGLVPALLFGAARLPVELAGLPPSATIFSSMFLHGSLMHVVGNMLYLWVFGNNIEDAFGSRRFIAFYLACGLAAALAQAFQSPGSTVPMIGASGAISGVLGAYLLYYPRAQVTVLIPIGIFPYTVRWPAGWVLGGWFTLQVASSLMADPSQPGVAWLAHVGGFLAGLAQAQIFRPR